MTESIKQLVLTEMKNWLSKVRDDSRVIGELCMGITKAKQEKIRVMKESLMEKADTETNYKTREIYSNATVATLELIVNEEFESMHWSF